jgi:Fic family protein
MTRFGLAKSYIWQQPDWPNLRYDRGAVADVLARARLEQGKVLGVLRAIGLHEIANVEWELWTGEAVATAAIEGEKLDLETVRSSVMRRLGDKDAGSRASRHVEGLLDVMQDATQSFRERLDDDRLLRWQSALFPGGTSGLRRIVVGRYRQTEEPMQIVSGPIGRERVHYEAPASPDVPEEMQAFLDWWERTRPGAKDAIEGLMRAGLAHLWFETIHPFEDGNGRVGRALIDLALAQDSDSGQRYCGLSRQLMARRDGYYDALNAAQVGSVDVTTWLLFFLEQFTFACETSQATVDTAIERSRFRAAHSDFKANDRQRKVIQRMLDAGKGGFEGGMSTEKYSNLAGTTKVTASRDLSDLLQAGLVVSTGQGRGTRYWVNVPGWAVGTHHKAK